MTVASGTRPYEYKRYPFILQEGELIGISGILIEEPMFSTLAERDIYAAQTGNARYFYKYYGEDFARVPIEPNPLGRNLDGTNQNPITAAAAQSHATLAGCVNYKDYVLDVRESIEGIWDLIEEYDSDYDAATLQTDYFSGIFNGERLDGKEGDEWFGVPTDTWKYPQATLAESGALADLDLREIQYQPIIRFSKYTENSYWPLPIWPSLCTPGGGLPRLVSYDTAYTPPAGPDNLPGINESGYDAVGANRFLIIGDVFVPSNSKGFLLSMKTGIRAGAGEASCTSIAHRSINRPMDGGIGYFSHGSYGVGTGLYRMATYQSAPTDTLHVSGFSSFWPPTTYDVDSFFSKERMWSQDDTYGLQRGSGLHVFYNGFWGVAGGGQVLYSPINTENLWLRSADQTSYTGVLSTYSWGTSYFHGDEFWTQSVWSQGPGPVYQERTEAASWSTDGDYNGLATSIIYYTADPRSTGPIVDLSDHSVGLSMAPYTILQGWEGSDGVTRFIIWDGQNARGSINVDGFSIAQNSPGINGTIKGTGFCNSPWVGSKNPWYFLPNTWEMSRDVFPLPVASGTANAATGVAGEVHYLKYAENIQHDFEQMNDSNYNQAGRPVFVQPEGELDTGDGSAFMQFSAKLKGSTTLASFIGRITTATSGAEKQIQIVDYWPGASISRCGDFT